MKLGFFFFCSLSRRRPARARENFHEKTLVCKGPFSLQVQVRSGSSIRTNDLDITERGYEHGPGFSGSFDIHVTFTIKKASSRSCNPSFFIVEFCEKKKKKKRKKKQNSKLGTVYFLRNQI